jgi:hypothetical protein
MVATLLGLESHKQLLRLKHSLFYVGYSWCIFIINQLVMQIITMEDIRLMILLRAIRKKQRLSQSPDLYQLQFEEPPELPDEAA